MTTILATIGLMATLMVIMAVGVIFRGKALKGSCGGVGTEDCLCLEEQKPIGSCVDDPEPGGENTPMKVTRVEDGVTVYE
jgi:hypothetical protein